MALWSAIPAPAPAAHPATSSSSTTPKPTSASHWGKVNQPFPSEKFDALLQRVLRHMAERDLYIMDLAAGADPTYRLPIQVICEYAWHALFVKQLFIRPEAARTRDAYARVHRHRRPRI